MFLKPAARPTPRHVAPATRATWPSRERQVIFHRRSREGRSSHRLDERGDRRRSGQHLTRHEHVAGGDGVAEAQLDGTPSYVDLLECLTLAREAKAGGE